MKKKKSNKRKLANLLAILVFGLAVAGGVFKAGEYQALKRAEYLSGKNIVYKMDDVLGVQTETASVTVDFGKQIATSSPLIFGIGNPNIKGPDVWDKVSNVGVNLVRAPIYFEWSIPKTTISDYLANKNNIQDPSTWNRNFIEGQTKLFKDAKAKGLKNIGIMAFSTGWLTYTGEFHGVPKNWDIYKDIIKKIYIVYRPYLDYVEIWNEPDLNYFLNPSGSGLSREEAYKQIFYYASEAIHEVDDSSVDKQRKPILASTSSNLTNTTILNHLLSDPKTSNNISYLSVHMYGTQEQLQFDSINAVLAKYNKKIPLILTEWNYTSEEKKPNPYLTSNIAIPYTGTIFTTLMKSNVAGANYFALNPIEPNATAIGHGYHSFYTWENNSALLLPQAKTWMLLSKTLGLGTSSAIIFQTQNTGPIYTTSFLISENKYGLILVNPNESTVSATVTFNNMRKLKKAKTYAYVASATTDGYTAQGSSKFVFTNNKGQMKILLPTQSVVGILIQPNTAIF